MIVAPEATEHHAAVRRLLVAAFPRPAEANLVARLRADGDAVIALVALEGTDVVGHVMLSRMTAPFRALGLAPLAVAAHCRRQGIACRLVAEAIGHAAAAGWDAIFVLGEPTYYRRFGFTAEDAAPFDSPYAGPNLMALILNANGPPTRPGRVDYAPAFLALG
jgi:putative acetyltransferase